MDTLHSFTRDTLNFAIRRIDTYSCLAVVIGGKGGGGGHARRTWRVFPKLIVFRRVPKITKEETISFIMSVRPSVCPHVTGLPLDGFS